MTGGRPVAPLGQDWLEPKSLTLGEVLSAVDGRLLIGNVKNKARGVSVNSRDLRPGELFVALAGPRFDGHDFVIRAFRKGACGAMVDEKKLAQLSLENGRTKAIIAVPDTLTALGNMAAYLRRKFPLPLVAVTGSNGKSTTKEMIAAIFSVSRPTLKNPGNYNNLVGLPLTLFRINNVHQLAVVELGMNQPGEIKRLSEICQPDVAVITNIGPVHLEKLKTLDGVAEAKKEILVGLKESGIVVYNINDDYCRQFFAHCPYQTVTFGLDNPKADISGKVFHQGGPRGLSAILDLGDDVIPVKLNSCGYHNLENALAAAAAAKSLGADTADIQAGLEEFKPLERRSQFRRLRGGIEILDDSYNANPRSMEMTFRLLQDISGGRRKLALLADMCELGDYAEGAHRQLGKQVAQSGFDRLVYLGAFGEIVAEAAMKEGMPDKAIFLCSDHDQACQLLTQLLEEGDLLLVKASRAMALERVVDALVGMLGAVVTN